MRKKRISKTSNYKIGRNFEYRVKRYYEEQGYYVVRSYASKGPADLYCMKNKGKGLTKVLLIQCKNYKGKLKEHEIEGLQLLAQATGGTPVHVWKNEIRELESIEIVKKRFRLSFKGILQRLKELKKRFIVGIQRNKEKQVC